MPIGTKADLNVRNPFLHTSLTERLTQFVDAFNSASNGAIQLSAKQTLGEASHETAFRNIASLVTRRDTTSTAAATSQKLINSEKTSIKLDRKIGPVDNTLSGFVKIGMGEDEMQVVVGEQAAVAMAVDMLDTGLLATRAALVAAQSGAFANLVAGTATTAALVSTLYKAGDRADRIVVWIMHSYVYSQLVQQQIAANIDGVSNFNVATATPVTLGRPVIVTDSAALYVDEGGGVGVDHYYTLGLTAGALELLNSESENVIFDIVTGNENLIARIQGEYAYTIGMKGFTYDLTNGGVNPNNTAIGTGTNWDIVVDSLKDGPGVVMRTNQ
jgi:hypothetical protein